MKLPLLFLSLSPLLTPTLSWKLDFYGTGDQYLKTHGTQDVSCNNLASSFTEATDLIEFDPATDLYPDPQTFTAYTEADCEVINGETYTGRGGRWTIDPPMRFRSYKLS